MQMNTLLDSWQQAIEKMMPLFLMTFCAGFLAYFYELANFSFSIDEEVFADPTETWNHHGHHTNRWGLIAVNRLITLNMVPYVNPFVALLFLSAAACFLAKKMQFNGPAAVVFGVSMVTFPQFAHQVQFLFQSAAAGLGILLSVIAGSIFFHLYEKFTLTKSLLFVALVAFVTSIYQSFIFVIPTVIVLILITKLLHEDYKSFSLIKMFLLCLVLLLVGMGLYLLVCTVLSGVDTAYGQDFFIWTDPGRTLYEKIIKLIFILGGHTLGLYYTGENLYAAVLCAMVLVCWHVLRKKPANTPLLVLLLLSVPVLPFVQIIVFGGGQPVRTLLSQGIVFAFAVSLFVQTFKVHTLLLYALSCIIFIYSTFHITNLFHIDLCQLERDKNLSQQIASRLHSLAEIGPQTKIILYGIPEGHRFIDEDPRHKQVFGSSFFLHDEGNIFRMRQFSHFYRSMNFSLPTRKDVLDRIETIKALPLWPHPGSVTAVDGIWVVKLGEAGRCINYLPAQD